MQWKVQNSSVTPIQQWQPAVTARSDSLVIFNSDSSDPSVVTPYSDLSSDGVYSVVVRFYSVYSDYSVYSVVNHLDSLYSVVVRGLY